jgi:hypothetical protein
MAMAIAVKSRLWLGGVISEHRDSDLIAALFTIVKACASVVLFSNAKLKLKLFYDKFVIVVNYKHSILFYDFVKEKQ